MKFSALLASLAFLISSIVMAAPSANKIRYNYISINATAGEIDAGSAIGDVDYAQVSVLGSWAIHENIALLAETGVGEIQTSDVCICNDIDTESASLGANIHFPLTPTLDVLIPVTFEYVDLDDGFESMDDTGYSIGLGVRALVNPSLELGVGFLHTDIGDEDDQSVGGSARWHFTDLVSLAFGISASSDVTSGTLSLRFTFD